MMINWGILGAGWIADKFVSDFKLVKDGRVQAVAARSLERSKVFAQRFEIPSAYGTYEDLVKDKQVDIIYIATTHNFHFEHAKLCLEGGKHVLCEKPVTVNAKELEVLIQIAKENKCFFMEAMWSTFLPSYLKAKEWVAEGLIGEVGVVQANFGFPASPEFTERLYSPDLAGGALLDLGVYPLTLINDFAQSPLKTYDLNHKLTDTGVDESMNLQLSFENGVEGQTTFSIKNRLKNHAFICGSKGMVELPDFWMGKKAILTVGDKVTEFVDDTDTMGYNKEVDAINIDLKEKRLENKVMPLSRSMRMMQLLDEIRSEIGLKYPFE